MKGKKPTAYTLKGDTEVAGLYVRTTAAGVAAYVFDRRVNGSSVRVTIGRVDNWKLKAARVEARRLATEYDRGIDPRITAAAARAQAEAARIESQRHTHTVAAVWAVYIADRNAAVEDGKKVWGDRHYRMHVLLAAPGGEKKKRGKGLTTPGPLAPLMGLKLSELTAETVEEWLRLEVKGRPTNAHQSYRLLRAFINWTHGYKATDKTRPYRGIVPADACTDKAVVDLVPSAKTIEGDCLQNDMLPAWFAAVRKIPNPVIAAYLQALLLTGARRNELAALKWVDVDFTWGSMVIRDKVQGKRTIPLTPFVASLINALPRKNKWVFTSVRSKDGRLMEPRIAHNEALDAANLTGRNHVSLHGLRRSFATLSNDLDEAPAGVFAQIQGHKPSGVREKNYMRRGPDMLRKWHTKFEARILELGGVSFTAPVRFGVVEADGSVRASA